jgi:hypothetical protein
VRVSFDSLSWTRFAICSPVAARNRLEPNGQDKLAYQLRGIRSRPHFVAITPATCRPRHRCCHDYVLGMPLLTWIGQNRHCAALRNFETGSRTVQIV